VGDVSYLVFSVSGIDLAVPARDVEQVTAVDEPTPIPGAPAHVLGLVAAGDRVLPVVDLERFLDLGGGRGKDVDPMFRRTLVVQGGDYEAGLVCHRARGLVTVAASDRRPPTVLQGARLRPFLTSEIDSPRGVVGLLDPLALLQAAAVS